MKTQETAQTPDETSAGGNPPPHPPLSASRPGYKTTEFWLTLLASLVGFLMASGMFSEGGQMVQILGWAGMLLANLGYQGNRALTKSSEAKAMAITADSASRAEAVKALRDPTKRSRSTE